MKTKTLETIQKVSNVLKILSKIGYILCDVFAIICLACLALAIFVPQVATAGIPIETIYSYTVCGFIMLAGESILSRFSFKYFKHELEAGTPFTFEGAKELKKLGIRTIVIPLVTYIITAIAYAIIASTYAGVDQMEFDTEISIGLGIGYIIMALICKYGAEIQTAEAPKEIPQSAEAPQGE